MYLFLSSTDCVASHPDNSAWDFTIDLKQYFHLKGKWECALMDIDYDGPPSQLFVFSDLCSDSYVTDSYLPLLRIVKKPATFKRPYFISIPRNFVDRLRVYIRTKDGQLPSFAPERLRCTLRIRERYVGN